MSEAREALDIVRSLTLPPDLAWAAWTDPEMLRQWWWPERFQTSYELDVRPGGSYRFLTADLPDFGRLDLNGAFLGVRPPEHLAYTWRWGDSEESTIVTVSFSPLDTGTNLRVRQEGFGDRHDRENHEVGWRDCLNRLASHAKDIAAVS